MTWVRLSDDFMVNAKIRQLSDADFRVWVRILCFCSALRTGLVTVASRREIAGLTPKRILRFKQLRLLDDDKQGWMVHDWGEYQPKDPTGGGKTSRAQAAPQP